MKNSLLWLEEFYTELCDGDWEHNWRVRISTIDNPGWSVKINVLETILENEIFSEITEKQDENHWVICKVRDNVFDGVGGPNNLETILDIFQNWYVRVSEK
jgi:hypothetical protein